MKRGVRGGVNAEAVFYGGHALGWQVPAGRVAGCVRGWTGFGLQAVGSRAAGWQGGA